MPNPVVHFEIIGRDAKRLQDFYAGVFGWKINASNPMAYGVVESQEGKGIGGGIAGTDEEGARTTFYIEVKDTDEFLRKVEAAGGKTLMPTTVIPGMVTMALFQDPEGNVVGLVNEETPPA